MGVSAMLACERVVLAAAGMRALERESGARSAIGHPHDGGAHR